ncbi:MAG TPA: DUF2085 domain-containing protein [Vicinamibacterales bacterium]|nr:DUF2085 domain-containing protein [Vicinamibacterales bacterium]
MPRVSALTYAAGALICHQRPERSIHHAGAQYPVCARCLGLYAGAVCGVLLWAGLAGIGRAPRRVATRLSHPTLVRRLLIITAFPTLVTVVASWLGWWDAGNAARLILALPLGGAIAAALAAVATGDLR